MRATKSGRCPICETWYPSGQVIDRYQGQWAHPTCVTVQASGDLDALAALKAKRKMNQNLGKP